MPHERHLFRRWSLLRLRIDGLVYGDLELERILFEPIRRRRAVQIPHAEVNLPEGIVLRCVLRSDAVGTAGNGARLGHMAVER